MSRRECWANVYVTDGIAHLGGKYPTHEGPVRQRAFWLDVRCIVHVKLKPEGAPRRYASEHDRRNWETYPEEMRKCPF